MLRFENLYKHTLGGKIVWYLRNKIELEELGALTSCVISSWADIFWGKRITSET